MVAENTDKTQLLDTSDDFPTLALEVTPEVVRKVKKITEEETQPLPDSDAATQVKKIEKMSIVFAHFFLAALLLKQGAAYLVCTACFCT